MIEQQVQAKPSQIGGWIVFAGVVVAAIGAVVLTVGHSKKAAAQRVLEFANSSRVSPALQSATTAVGLGVLIFGLALLLCGVVVTALKR